MDQKIDQQLIDDFRLGNLSEEAQQDAVIRIYQLFEVRMGAVMTEKLSEEQIEAFGKLVEAGDQDAAIGYLREQIPGYDALIDQEYEDFKEEYSTVSGDLHKK